MWFNLSRSIFSHAKEEHKRDRVLPVPVGDSNKAFSELIRALIT
jgi:hypothetical protein